MTLPLTTEHPARSHRKAKLSGPQVAKVPDQAGTGPAEPIVPAFPVLSGHCCQATSPPGQ
jgi:hypothetical protein